MNQPTPQPKQPLTNTLRMREAELSRLHDEMESGSHGAAHKRKCIRWDFLRGAVRVEMHQPGGVTTNLRYAARNISAEGVGILHSSFVHTGTACVVFLVGPTGKEIPVEGVVVRCRHYKGLIHEVGIRFKDAVNVREFMQIDPLEGRFTLEHVDPEKLQGSVLHIDDSAMDRRLIRHFLKDTNLNVVAVEDASSGLKRLAEGFDILLVDNDLPDMPGPVLVEQLRAKGTTTPIIMLTADTRQAAKDAAKAAKVNAIIGKPVSQDLILRAIAEFLLLESSGSADGGGPLYSTLKPEDPAAKFIPDFIDELKSISDKFNKAVAAEDYQQARRLSFQLKGAAPALGFAPLGEAADAAMLALDATMSVQESSKQIRALLASCQRVRVRDEHRRAG